MRRAGCGKESNSFNASCSTRDDGAWDDGADMPIANTAFAIPFLTRATKPY